MRNDPRKGRTSALLSTKGVIAEPRYLRARSAAVRRRGVAESLAYPRPMTVVERLPGFIAPMLLTSTPELPANDGWSLEVKWDGMRAQLRCDGRRVTLRSRPGRDRTAELPEMRPLAALIHVQ